MLFLGKTDGHLYGLLYVVQLSFCTLTHRPILRVINVIYMLLRRMVQTGVEPLDRKKACKITTNFSNTQIFFQKNRIFLLFYNYETGIMLV